MEFTFYDLNKNKRWVNSFKVNKNASFKISNLRIANEIGLITPKTIVTNDPEKAEDFCKLCNWNILVKPFSFEVFFIKKTSFRPFSNKINSEEFYRFKAQIELAPTLLQEYIEKYVELRVTIIGSKIFTAALFSQEGNLNKYDFRNNDAYGIRYEVFQLPKEIEDRLLKFNHHYNLLFSTFDLILTPEGNIVFLECNPNGQWLWIEKVTNMPISLAVAEFLLS